MKFYEYNCLWIIYEKVCLWIFINIFLWIKIYDFKMFNNKFMGFLWIFYEYFMNIIYELFKGKLWIVYDYFVGEV